MISLKKFFWNIRNKFVENKMLIIRGIIRFISCYFLVSKKVICRIMLKIISKILKLKKIGVLILFIRGNFWVI